MPTKIRHSL
ncbi:hypothetical protein B4U80_03696 [Leptotrombidium deliense]|uniref:Uncharacterized protein n=1 Tax=Leptotrombidium deliense TaxID=299467 RepID=A0A443SSX4_9ACAR|nr:hypothetical protein B4U80_03696 [Leptotrombidium deliense]